MKEMMNKTHMIVGFNTEVSGSYMTKFDVEKI